MNSEALDPISLAESKRLIELERQIQSDVKRVGAALIEIRDEKLWRGCANSFEEYCKAKWGWGRSRAEQLITAAKVVQQLPADVTTGNITERQARELAKIDPEKRAEVLNTVERNGKVTARAIREAAREQEPARVVAHTEVMPSESEEEHRKRSVWRVYSRWFLGLFPPNERVEAVRWISEWNADHETELEEMKA